MAKFFVTNNQKYYNSLKNQIAETDFRLSFDFADGKVYALAVHKLGMLNRNAIQMDSNFCIATGTCIYKESLDYSYLLKDFDENISRNRENSLGQYAVSILKDNKLTVYGDACGCYDIYYYRDELNTSWLISNSLYDIARTIGHELLTLNEFNVVQRMANRYIPNAETFFDQIKYLRGDEYIEINVLASKWSINHINVEFPVEEDDFDTVVSKAAAELKRKAGIIAKALGTPTICVTGGLDSRLVLASFLANGIKPKLFYGVGNNQITSPRKEDELCADKLSKEFGLEVIKGDFSVSDPLNADWDYYINNCGFTTAYMWGGQRNVIRSLSSGSDLLMFGWGGELLRNISNWTEQKEEQIITLKELLSKWYIARAESAPLIRDAITEYDSLIEKLMRGECYYLGLNPDLMSIDDAFLLERCYRSTADTQIPSFMQHYKYVYLLLFEETVLRHRVKCAEKDFARFMLSICYALCPQTFNYPLFTHQQWKNLEASTMTLQPVKTSSEKLVNSFWAKMLRRLSPEPLKRYILRPFKRKIVNHKTEPKLAPNCVITSFDKLKDAQYDINMSDVRRSEDTVMWAILLRALKSLGY